MGRKTWDSIPSRFRPLKDRRNVIISRNLPPTSSSEPSSPATVNSISEALDSTSQSLNEGTQGRVFVIGGAQIYAAALQRPETKRILLTRILSDFECDAFFPVILGENGKAEGWRKSGSEEFDKWTGEALSGKVQEEAGTKYVFEMWERAD
ncbi:uncharacterized protein BP5553_05612 [Venustampulla echinocandica]|uniref:Dihydrofolate reductase n=1 Tax=Venustampulla echinocandica TaxID=2656787 RepID=A0A370TRM1_9HELO|nr:uncharacterized protein BP5553_05612 [Venustampulla echinocandica]RDL38179.1 hypothetical protein BP5553_05612 [Venustampulla echinocandica]